MTAQANRVWLKRHDDDKFFDAIEIKTVPRFKMSELSGDEWRVSTTVYVYRKGHQIGEPFVYSDIDTAVAMLPGDLIRLREEIIDLPKTDHLCFQPGCSEEAAVEYRLKKEYCRQGHAEDATRHGRETHIRFCSEHAERGDCGLEDADANYETVAKL
jgi:hypothetical protein